MMEQKKYFGLTILTLTICYLINGVNTTVQQPHIIFILADDLGFNDVSFHGSAQIPTPNIDALAYSGIILNRYYVSPICTPSRAALMTGKYPIHTGMQHGVIYGMEPRGLPLNETILPQYLNNLGYTSHIVGKWHLGHYKLDYSPVRRGFKSHVGPWTGHHDYYDHTAFEQGTVWGLDMRRGINVARDLHGVYSTELITNESVKIIEAHNTKKPLFLYVSHVACHSANYYNFLPAPDKVVEKLDKIDNFYRRKYAAITTELDRSVGEIVKALDNRGMLSNSIIIFSADNGGPAEGFNDNAASNWPLRGVKNTLWEGGVRGAGFIWSNLLKQPKRVSNQLMHIVDWLPTLLSAAGENMTTIQNLDGMDLWSALSEDKDSPRKEALLNTDDIWGSHGIIVGDYKLLNGTNYHGIWDSWYGPAGDRGPDMYDFDKVANSQAGSILNAMRKLPRKQTMRKIRHDATIDCPPVQEISCNPLEEPCLFNIVTDPCERINLAKDHQNMVNTVLNRLEHYRSTAKPPNNQKLDPRGDPKYWDYTWTNFGDHLLELTVQT